MEDIGRVHPIPGKNCTLAIVNPMSSTLQWLSVDCYKQYTVSSLICERNNNNRALHNIYKILYVDLTNYVELWNGGFKDTGISRKCPGGGYVLKCYGAQKVTNYPELDNFRIMRPQTFRTIGQGTINDLYINTSKLLAFFYQKTCVRKFYNDKWKVFGYKSMDPNAKQRIGHVAICPLKLNVTKLYNNLSLTNELSFYIRRGMIISSDKKICPKYSASFGGKCVSMSSKKLSVHHEIRTKSQSIFEFIFPIMTNYGVCVMGSKNGDSGCRLINNTDRHITLYSQLPQRAVSSHVCPHGLFPCSDGHCVSDMYINDGQSDCPDGSDESLGGLRVRGHCTNFTCTCSLHFFQSATGSCIVWNKINNNIDCWISVYDEVLHVCNAIESKPPIRVSGKYDCTGTNLSIPGDWLNDLIPDCPKSDDEPPRTVYIESPDCPGQLQCSPGHPHCFPFHTLCLYDHDKYGHLRFCRNGAHLSHCAKHSCFGYFKCPLAYCVPALKLCDNITDCPMGEDEQQCPQYNHLLCPGFLRCKGGHCVHPLQICDGHVDCKVGQEDEDNCNLAPCPDNCDCLGSSMICWNSTIFNVSDYQSFDRAGSHSDKIVFIYGMHLINVNISSNLLVRITRETFRGLSRLVVLDVSHNNIRQIDAYSFKEQVMLRKIYFQGNQIRFIEYKAFVGLNSISITRFV